jgi:hypothetical protein
MRIKLAAVFEVHGDSKKLAVEKPHRAFSINRFHFRK